MEHVRHSTSSYSAQRLCPAEGENRSQIDELHGEECADCCGVQVVTADCSTTMFDERSPRTGQNCACVGRIARRQPAWQDEGATSRFAHTLSAPLRHARDSAKRHHVRAGVAPRPNRWVTEANKATKG